MKAKVVDVHIVYIHQNNNDNDRNGNGDDNGLYLKKGSAYHI